MKDAKPKRIGILAGGPSSEREISLKSGEAVYNALAKEGHDVIFIDVKSENEEYLKTVLDGSNIDIAFIALHGRFGEDGTLQGILDMLSIPYTGSGAVSSRNALDKIASKQIFAQHGIDTPPYRIFKKGQPADVEDLGLPVVVKPRREGSSIGLSVVREKENLRQAFEKAFKYGEMLIVEKYIGGREITVGILGDEPLCVIQIVSGSGLYDYEAKYSRTDTQYLVPAPISRLDYEKSRDTAKKAHMALGCRAFSRVDMILGDDGAIYVLEVNTIPGFTTRSLLPKAAEHEGITFAGLCERIIMSALK